MEYEKKIGRLAKLTAVGAIGLSSILPQEKHSIDLSVFDIPYNLHQDVELIENLKNEVQAPDRYDCSSIRGTQYHSEEERSWYLQNCIRRPSTTGTAGFIVTHYGERFNGNKMGCQNAGNYSSDNETILAVSPALEREIPCGKRVRLTNPANGAVLEVVRQDQCPLCSRNHVDLSEAGIDKLAGKKDSGTLSGIQLEIYQD